MIISSIVGILIAYALISYVRRKIAKPDYKGKTVWITGASSGIGQSLAYEFNKNGAFVILTARNVKQLQRVKEACAFPEKAEVLPLDMTNYKQVQEKTQQYLAGLQSEGRRLDIIVENAGISMRCEFVNYAFENHTAMFNINVHAPFNHLQAIVPHFLRQGGGQIVGISSLAGKLAKAYRSSYAGSKHAFLGILDSLRSELKPHNIRVCNILPGYIKTNLSKNALGASVGQKFGRSDENIQKGMDANQFAKEAVGAIYNNQNEVSIGKEWSPVIGLILRNICPDLTFLALRSSAKDKPNPKKE